MCGVLVWSQLDLEGCGEKGQDKRAIRKSEAES